MQTLSASLSAPALRLHGAACACGCCPASARARMPRPATAARALRKGVVFAQAAAAPAAPAAAPAAPAVKKAVDPTPIIKLQAGFKRYKEEIVKNQPELFNYLAKTQTPKVMVIGCADSRVDAAVLFGSEPGEIFQVRSVANLVPPYERGGNFHGVSAALEFAVTALKVEHIIVLGHSKCGGIKALVQRRLVENRKETANDFIDDWVSIADPAVERTRIRTKGMDVAAMCTDCEQTSIDQSLQNLMTFPWIQQAVNEGRLNLHGWYYDVSENPSLKMWNLEMKKSNEAIIS